MAGDWFEVTLGDLLEVKHGFAFEGKFFSEKLPGPVLLTPGNFYIGGGFNPHASRYFHGDVPKTYELSPGDLVVTMTDLSKAGDTLGYSARIPNDGRRYLHNQRIGKIVGLSETLLSLDFAYWLFRSPAYRAEVLASATGSTVRHTSPSRIKAFRFYLPTLPEQEKISDVLNAIDEKVEMNRRMAETLEAIARALFKSWFVDFDPVRARSERRSTGLPDELAVLFPDNFGEDGLPRGWHIQPLSKLGELDRTTCSPSEFGAATVSHFSIPAFDAGRQPVLEAASNIKSLKLRLTPPVVLFAKLNPGTPRIWPVVSTTDRPALASTEYLAFRPARHGMSFTYLAMLLSSQPLVTSAASMVTGTSKSHQRVQADSLLSTTWPAPPGNIVSRFDMLSEPLLLRADAARNQCETLAELRNTLLPKLISGELRIADAERCVAAA